MASDAAAAGHSDVTAGSRLHPACSQLGQDHPPMAAPAQSCCVADRRFPYYGKTTFFYTAYMYSSSTKIPRVAALLTL